MPIKSTFFTCKDGSELLFYFSLDILDLWDSFTRYFELSWLYYQCCLFVKQVSAFMVLIFDVLVCVC